MPGFRFSILKPLLPALMLFGVLRVVFWLTTFPNPDEAYYWVWGQHPDFSYYDHPPFQAWMQGLTTALLGKSFFSLRLANLVSTTLIFYTYYQISKYLYGKYAADFFWMTIALLLASPLYFLFLALAWHDHWLITFCLIASFQFIQFLDSYQLNGRGDSRWLYGTAIALGMALLCKYNAVFVGLGFLASIVFNPQWRKLLRDRRLHLALTITLVFLLPIVIWNVTHDFQSLQYYRDRSVDNAGFRLKVGETLGFIAFSILMLSPINSWAIRRVLLHPPRTDQSTAYYQVAFWIFCSSTLSLIAISLVSTALYYWNILAYLLLFPLLPTIFLPSPASPASPASPPLRPLFLIGQGYGLLFAVLLVVHYSILPLSAFSSADSDPDSRMLWGWDQVAAIVQQQARELHHPALITTDYRSASALAYQLHDPNVFAISDRVDQFDFWVDLDRLKGRDAVILADDWHPLTAKLETRFTHLSKPETLSIRRFGIWIKNYYIFRGYAFRGR